MVHGPITSITKFKMLGGYDHVYFLKMLGGYRLTSITNFIFCGGYPRIFSENVGRLSWCNVVNSCPNH